LFLLQPQHERRDHPQQSKPQHSTTAIMVCRFAMRSPWNCDHVAEEEEEAARETEEVEDEVFVYEISQAALRELEREVDHLHVITCSNALLTMLCRAPLLPLPSTLPSPLTLPLSLALPLPLVLYLPLTLPLSLALSLLLTLPLLLALFLRMSRPQLSLKAYVIP
jgi:hypothetical protein